MLVELSVRNLGVIDDVRVVLGSGMTALTGETGAGKTLLVEAIDLLVGGRPDAVLVRPGAEEAVVEGRFIGPDGDDVVISRVVPATGRTRAYVNGRMAPVSTLAELGAALVDLHGQHAHQSLLSSAVQRAALDRFGGLAPLVETLGAAHARVRDLDDALSGLGGDGRARAREMDLLEFQVAELDAAAVDDPDEDAALEAEEDLLADATAHRLAAAGAYRSLQDEGGAADAVGIAVAALAGRAPLAALADRLRLVTAELTDIAAELREASETLSDDPRRLAEVQARRHLLRELRRKYGSTLGEVMAFAEATRRRLEELVSYEARAAQLEAERSAALDEAARAARALAEARRRVAGPLAAAIEANLHALAMDRARFEVSVGADAAGDDVVFGLGANPGEPVHPLAKVASGGELARAMLAVRLVLSEGPPTLVFDEVDAGIGGAAALAVGRSLASLGDERQVLVVTHLPQVADYADAQVVVTKAEQDGRTVARANRVEGDARLIELSRMLSGRPDSPAGRRHAAELLASAAARQPLEAATRPAAGAGVAATRSQRASRA